MPTPISLLIAHPKELIRAGLRAMLAQSLIKIIGEAEDAPSTLSLAKKHKPDVALIDVGIPGEADCFVTVGSLLESVPATKVVMLSTLDNPIHMARAKAAGVSDFLLEGVTTAELATTVENAAQGKPPCGTESFAKIAATMDGLPHQAAHDDIGLSPREVQVLLHVTYGLSNEEIARSLKLDIETVRTHVRRTLRKLGLHDRAQATGWALRSGVF